MSDFFFLLAQSQQQAEYDRLMQAGQFYETLGWILGIAAFVILVGGLVLNEVLRRRKK